jgi:hypothetical protein
VKARFDKEEIRRKIGGGLSLGLLGGLLAGVFKAVFFVIQQQYTRDELLKLWPELLVTPLSDAVLPGLAAGVLFAAAWIIFDRTAHVALTFFVVALPFLPLVYFLNKEFLPGIREPKSIVGNGLVAVAFTVCCWLVFQKWASRFKLTGKILNRKALMAIVVGVIGLYGVYFLQPSYARLTSSPKIAGSGFFDLFAFENDSLSAIRNALASKDFAAASQLLFEYLQWRRQKHLQRLEAIIDNADSALVIAKADSTLRRSFTFWGVNRELPQHFDWQKNPTKDRVWLFALNQQKWLAEVSQAYVLTHDEKYARDFSAVLESWFEQNDLPKWKNERHPVWRLMETGIRGVNWVDALFIFLNSPSLSRELKLRVLASLHDHGQFLYHFRSPQHNHLLRESYSLLQIAVLLPEFKMSKRWEEISLARLARAVEEDVYVDGGYVEGSTYYHRFAMRVLQEIKNFAETNKVELPVVITQRLEGMYDFLMYLSLPDGAMPQINDGFYSRDLRESFAAPAKEFDRRDFEYFSSNGAAGDPPRFTSKGFPNSGVYAMRSDWSDDALYCIVDAGPYGSSHGHEDKLSFELHAFGTPFIIEAGTYNYLYDEWHKFFESSFAHNTIVVDGKGQFRQADEAKWTHRTDAPLPNTWVSTSDFDYLAAVYDDGYGDKKENVDYNFRHERRMLFVKPEYWILWDIVSSASGAKEEEAKNGASAHRFDQLFHFAPMDVEIFADGELVRAKKAAGPNLLIYSLLPEKVEMKKTEGQLDPIQGWISPAYGKSEPAPVMINSQVASTPAVFLNVLVPVAGSKSPALDVKNLIVSMNGQAVRASDGVAILLKNAEWSDYILLTPNLTGDKTFGKFASTQQLYFKRVNDSGQTIRHFESDLQPGEAN